MKPPSELHPEIAKFLAKDLKIRAKFGIKTLCNETLPKLRTFSDMAALVTSSAPIHHIENRSIPGAQEDISIRIYSPSDTSNLPILMWFHGGGWVVGHLNNADDLCRKISHHTQCIVISVDYHLAPEYRFPIAIEDCYAATLWAKKHAAEFGGDATRIAVGGDSAGGNLAACTTILCKEKKLPLTFQWLLYPVIEADFERPSYRKYADNVNLTRHDMQWFWDCYVPDQNDRTHPLVSPIQTDDLSGLPPALVMTAECDPLCDEGAAYAKALESAGVPTHYQCYTGMIHGFFNLPTSTPIDAIEKSFSTAVSALQSAFKA
jgi:acetyl esterase